MNSQPTRADYLERAANCERLAKTAVTKENREILLELARRWRIFADQIKPQPGEK